MIKCIRIAFWQRYKGYVRGGRVGNGDKTDDEAVIKDGPEGVDYSGGRINRTWWPQDAEWEVSLSREGCLGSWIGHVVDKLKPQEEGQEGAVRGGRIQWSGSIAGEWWPESLWPAPDMQRELGIKTWELLTVMNPRMSLRPPAYSEGWDICPGLGYLPVEFATQHAPWEQRQPLHFLHSYCTVSSSQYQASSRCSKIFIGWNLHRWINCYRVTKSALGNSEDPAEVRNHELLRSSQPSSLAFFSSTSVEKQRRPREGRWGEEIGVSPAMRIAPKAGHRPRDYHSMESRLGQLRAFSAGLSLLSLQRGICLHSELLHIVSHEEKEAHLIHAMGGDTPLWAATPIGAWKGLNLPCTAHSQMCVLPSR